MTLEELLNNGNERLDALQYCALLTPEQWTDFQEEVAQLKEEANDVTLDKFIPTKIKVYSEESFLGTRTHYIEIHTKPFVLLGTITNLSIKEDLRKHVELPV